jgi:hypothetical protein
MWKKCDRCCDNKPSAELWFKLAGGSVHACGLQKANHRFLGSRHFFGGVPDLVNLLLEIAALGVVIDGGHAVLTGSDNLMSNGIGTTFFCQRQHQRDAGLNHSEIQNAQSSRCLGF